MITTPTMRLCFFQSSSVVSNRHPGLGNDYVYGDETFCEIALVFLRVHHRFGMPCEQ